MTEIPNLHDRFFKDVLSRKEEARDFMLHYLPQEVVGLLEADSLELAKDSFVDKELQDRFSDLLYRLKLRSGRGAYVYVLFEHKSAPEPLIALHLLRYMVKIWEQWLQQGGVGPLPPIIPWVVYTGGGSGGPPWIFAPFLPRPGCFRPFFPTFATCFATSRLIATRRSGGWSL